MHKLKVEKANILRMTLPKRNRMEELERDSNKYITAFQELQEFKKMLVGSFLEGNLDYEE